MCTALLYTLPVDGAAPYATIGGEFIATGDDANGFARYDGPLRFAFDDQFVGVGQVIGINWHGNGFFQQCLRVQWVRFDKQLGCGDAVLRTWQTPHL